MKKAKKAYDVRQSDIGAYLMCPERKRLQYDEPVEEPVTSDQVRGNVAHAAIEDAGRLLLAGREVNVDDLIESGRRHQAVMFPDVSEWRQPKERTEAAIEANLECWFWDVLPKLNVEAVEQDFRFLWYERDAYDVYLKGTIDWIDTGLDLVDWKFPGRPKNPREDWQLRRWDVQSTVYSWALANIRGDFETPTDFHRVHITDGEVHWVTLKRDAADWLALEGLVDSYIGLREADLKRWPMNWAGWWCSPKWCGHWDQCRGAYLGEQPW